jgi:type I restriction enzyme R subunit
MKTNIASLNRIHEAIKELNRKNNLLKLKFENDEKYVRVFKRVAGIDSNFRTAPKNLLEALQGVKNETDDKISNNKTVTKNEGFFNQLMGNIVINNFEKKGFKLDYESANKVSRLATKEYLQQFNQN